MTENPATPQSNLYSFLQNSWLDDIDGPTFLRGAEQKAKEKNELDSTDVRPYICTVKPLSGPLLSGHLLLRGRGHRLDIPIG